jgi:zinc transport system substrate-binding protein
VAGAAVYFRCGVPFERGAWFQALGETQDLKMADLRQGVQLRSGHEHEHHDHSETGREEHEGQDPHIWLSLPRLKIQAQTIAHMLRELDPAGAEDYAQNLAAAAREIDEADAAIREKLKPAAGRAFFVYHPAWGYFADDYGLRQVAVEVEGQAPTDYEMTKLQQQARAEGAQALFVQPQVSGRSAEAIARALGLRLETLDPLAEDILAELRRTGEALAELLTAPAARSHDEERP